MSISLLGKTQGFVQNGTSFNISYTSSAGSSLILLVDSSANTTVAVSDTLLSTWITDVALEQHASDAVFLAAFRVASNAGGANTITVNFGASTFATAVLAEYSGLGPIDTVSAINGNIFNSAPITTSVTPAASGELAVAIIGNNGVSSTTLSAWTNGFTQEDAVTTRVPLIWWADQVLSTGAAVTTSATLGNNDTWAALMLLYKAASTAQMPNLFAMHRTTQLYPI